MDIGLKLPVVEYKNGTIDAQWIPYGRRWVLRGSREVLQGTVDLVLGSATRPKHDTTWTCWAARPEPEREPKKEPPTNPSKPVPPPTDPVVAAAQAAAAAAQAVSDAVQATAAAARPAQQAGSGSASNQPPPSFELTFGPHVLGATYEIDLQFYQRLGPPHDDLVRTGLADAFRRAYVRSLDATLAAEGTSNSDSIKAWFEKEISAALSVLKDSGTVVAFDLTTQGACVETHYIPFELASTQPSTLQDIVLDDYNYRVISRNLGEARGEMGAVALRPEFRNMISRLQEIEQSSNSLPLRKGDTEALRSAFVRGDTLDRHVLARLDSLQKDCPPAACMPPEECQLFKGTVHRAKDFGVSHAEMQDLKPAVLQARKDAVLQKIIDDLRKQYFVNSGYAFIDATSWDDAQATVDRLRIGTVLSIGAAALGDVFDRDRSQFAAFALYSLKFYFYAVDKSLPDPYYGRFWGGRTSIVLGFMRGSKPSYQGRELDHPTAIGSPFFGLGFDLTRSFTLQVGTLFVRQQSTIGLEGRGLTAVPALSLGIDFDAANFVKDLLKGTNILP